MPQDARTFASAQLNDPAFHAPAMQATRPRGRRVMNRETSWVDFDSRVLELAATPRLPLLQRVKLCGIVSSNLDEFFAVRVARLLKRRQEGDLTATPDGATAAETLAALRTRVVRLQAGQDNLWHESLLPELAGRGILVHNPADGPISHGEAAGPFRRRLVASLEPVEIAPGAPFPRLRALTVAILAETASAGSGSRRTFVIALPAQMPRFVPLDLAGGGLLIGVEDLLADQIQAVLGTTPTRQAVFRMTRDALVPPTLDADRPEAESELRDRREWRNEVVRLEVSAYSDEQLAFELAERLGLREDQVYRSSAPLGLAALRNTSMLTGGEDQSTRYEASPAPASRDVFASLAVRDVLAHHPYESFTDSVDAFTAAAREPGVTALQATVYRTGNPSGTLAKLMEAARDGRRTVCVMELRARFDEAPNISWTRKLRSAGVEVLHGPPNVKVHAKLALIERREGAASRRYVHIGTGNYHASNASVYEDLSLFTADAAIAADAGALFDVLAGRSGVPRFEKLVVGPWYLKPWLLAEIARVARGAGAGHPSRIRIKVNAVADPDVVAALYAASADGVQIDVVVRGICTLRPGVSGLSDTMSVRSVLGPFLEHSRIFSFETGGHRRLVIGSADLLTRNLERRIEVLAPVEDPALRARVDGILEALLADTAYAWDLMPDGGWRRVQPAPGSRVVSAHELLLERAKADARTPWQAPSGFSGSLGLLRSGPEEGERRHDAPVHVSGIGEPELCEDRIDVSLDAARGDLRCHRDGGVAAALGDEAEDLELPRRQPVELTGESGCDERGDDL
jgi:polyphosphate kinase